MSIDSFAVASSSILPVSNGVVRAPVAVPSGVSVNIGRARTGYQTSAFVVERKAEDEGDESRVRDIGQDDVEMNSVMVLDFPFSEGLPALSQILTEEIYPSGKIQEHYSELFEVECNSYDVSIPVGAFEDEKICRLPDWCLDVLDGGKGVLSLMCEWIIPMT